MSDAVAERGAAAGGPGGPRLPGRFGLAASRLVELIPVALVVVAEAAWISVLGGLLQEFVFNEPVLSLPVLAAFVVAGIIAARVLGRRLGNAWPVVALGLIVAAGTLGWLASPAARTALGVGLGTAIAAHPGGWMAGLAVLRGFAYARLPLVEGTVARLLGLGVPGLAIAAILGGVIVEPFRGRFLADALGASILFIVAATLALALIRLSVVGSDAGFDWRRNPAWLGLTLGIVAVATVAAMPLSVVAGPAIETVIALALIPGLILGLFIGLDRTIRRVVFVLLGWAVVIFVITRVFGGNGATGKPPNSLIPGTDTTSGADQVITFSVVGLSLAVGVTVILVLAALWMRRFRPPAEDPLEESRTIDRGQIGRPRLRGRRWLGRRPAPETAAAAYVALVVDLEDHPAVRRGPAETPAEHAARLRADGRTALSLDLLAADYALARYGGVELSAREDRRAVGRWRGLRRHLVRPRSDAG